MEKVNCFVFKESNQYEKTKKRMEVIVKKGQKETI